MIIKRQKGAALVVAIIITLVIGLMAVGISKIAATGQKRENIGFGNAVSQSNAVSAVKAAQGFIKAVVADTKQNYDIKLFDINENDNSTSKATSKNDNFSINNKTVNLANLGTIYQGVEKEGSCTSTSVRDGNPKICYSTGDDVVLWYRDNSVWGDKDACPTCVDVNGDQTSFYRVEKRGFATFNAGSASAGSKIGYQLYRVTARGVDPATRSTTILQTHIGILGAEE